MPESVGNQIDRLAEVIAHEIPGEPSRSEGVIDTAIRLLRKAYSHPSALPTVAKQRENKPLTTLPRAFILQRDVDPTGIAGIGVVAWGVEFPDKVCAVRWTNQWPTSVVFHDRGIESIDAVHGHGGQTRIIFINGMEN